LIAAGVHGLTPLGSTGEFAYLNNAPARALVRNHDRSGERPRARHRWRRLHLDRGCGGAGESYQKLGADGILAILEAYFPLADAQGRSILRAIADASIFPS